MDGLDEDEIDRPNSVNPAVARNVFLGIALLFVAGLIAVAVLRPSATPPPSEIANDPLLTRGRELFLNRCASCHGQLGKGDGPIAKNLKGPPVGNLTDSDWKHGDAPERVFEVISKGVKNSDMAAWGGIYGPPDLRALAAYVFHLAGRDVPEVLRRIEDAKP